MTAIASRRINWAVIGSSVVHEPLLVLYSLLAFILHKNLGATPLQIGVLMMLKPVASIFSLYWTSWMNRGRRSLRRNILLSGLLGRLPFFLFPFISNVWVVIGLAALFMMLFRGGMPPYMEALKLNVPRGRRGRVFSRGLAIGYAEGVVLGIAAGWLLDGDPQAWRWLFPVAATLGAVGSMLQASLPIPCAEKEEEMPARVSLVRPWKQSFQLMRDNIPFRRFQIGFMVAAFGLMMMFPALPVYFNDILGLSYTQLAIALAVAKGVGFASTSSWWGHRFEHAPIFRFISGIFLLFGAFALCLLLAGFSAAWVYAAYLLYGVAQAGSELVWHMCGPMFSKDQDSAPYSSTNVVMVGIRGLLGPSLGALLLTAFSPYVPMAIGTSLFFASALLMRLYDAKPVVSKVSTL